MMAIHGPVGKITACGMQGHGFESWLMLGIGIAFPKIIFVTPTNIQICNCVNCTLYLFDTYGNITYTCAVFCRSVREGVAAVRGQADREAQNPDIQMHVEPSFQRKLQLQRTLGEDQGVFVGRDGDGLRQYRKERADWTHPIGW